KSYLRRYWMSNSTPKRGLSGLMSKFLRSGSGGSSSSSSDDRDQGSGIGDQELEETDPRSLTPDPSFVSPLALMNEASPEAWLGQFLLQLELETKRGTLHGAKMDADLLSKLNEVRAASGEGSPLQMLDAEYASRLRAENWAAWWKAQDNMSL